MEYSNFIYPDDIFQLQYHTYQRIYLGSVYDDNKKHNIYGPASMGLYSTHYHLCDKPQRLHYPHTMIRTDNGAYMIFDVNNEDHVISVNYGIIHYYSTFDKFRQRTFHVVWKGDMFYTMGSLIFHDCSVKIDRYESIKAHLRKLHAAYKHLF